MSSIFRRIYRTFAIRLWQIDISICFNFRLILLINCCSFLASQSFSYVICFREDHNKCSIGHVCGVFEILSIFNKKLQLGQVFGSKFYFSAYLSLSRVASVLPMQYLSFLMRRINLWLIIQKDEFSIRKVLLAKFQQNFCVFFRTVCLYIVMLFIFSVRYVAFS